MEIHFDLRLARRNLCLNSIHQVMNDPLTKDISQEQLPRRAFLSRLGLLTAAGTLAGFSSAEAASKPFFKISLAEWSLNGSIKAGRLKNLDFPVRARRDFDIGAVEYVSTLFDDHSTAPSYLKELKKRCSDNGVKSLLIMVDEEGDLAERDATIRNTAVENHYKWVDAAHFLGCHSIRVNCKGAGSPEAVAAAGVEGLGKLSEYGKKAGLNVIVENHGGYSSNSQWLTGVIRSVGMKNCGTLPDFGNFNMGNDNWYDRYKGVEEMMPFAKAVSAKAYNFDEQGNCVETDYVRMLKIVKAAKYRGYIGIEYEGSKLSEDDGIRATKNLLERVGASL